MLRPTLLALVTLAPSICAQDSQEDFFGLDQIWDIHIELEREDWVQMYPQGDGTTTRLFGKFPYRIGKVTIGSHVLDNVAVRMKGNATFLANGGTLKKSLKLDFNREDPEQKFLGMGKLNLQCNALDGTQIKEAVSYQIYRDCGVVAGRTCFARVFLTLHGELEEAYIGLYTVVEQVDQRYAKRTLGSGGLILKPQGETFAYLGEQWNEDYDGSYFPKTKVTEELTQPLIETAALFDEPSDEAFVNGIEAVMDVERFLKYTAVSSILINTDSPLLVPDNYYLIVTEETKLVTIVPWDMNWSMGAYGYITQTPTLDLSVMMPTQKEVFRRVLSQPRFKERYRELVAEYIAGPCSAEAMTAAIERAHATVEEALAEEEMRIEAIMAAGPELGGRPSRMPVLQPRDGDDVSALLEWAGDREKSVLDQLAGKSEGVTAPNLWGSNDRTPRG
ncbi:MAG: CotH kinase family protein, partial [Planctomycetota bacterium]